MPLTHSVDIIGVASSAPEAVFTQDQVRELLGIKSAVVTKLLAAPHIATRRLLLPNEGSACGRETHAELYQRFLDGARKYGADAARRVLEQCSVAATDIDFVTCVTSSGIALPGLSAHLMRDLQLKRSVHRLDVVGMGCNAGLTALKNLCMTLAGGAAEGTLALLVCVEINSAIYVNDDDVASGIVNSLFGDAAVATLVRRGGSVTPVATVVPKLAVSPSFDVPCSPTVALVDFESCTLTDYFDDMHYEVAPKHDKLCFRLSKQIPFVVGGNVHVPVLQLLERHGMSPKDIRHWVVHTGGAAVIEGIKKNLGLSSEQLRHTVSILRDYGNVSSGSFLMSYERLVQEHQANLATTKEKKVVGMMAPLEGTADDHEYLLLRPPHSSDDVSTTTPTETAIVPSSEDVAVVAHDDYDATAAATAAGILSPSEKSYGPSSPATDDDELHQAEVGASKRDDGSSSGCGILRRGDPVVMISMGPGTTIEVALGYVGGR